MSLSYSFPCWLLATAFCPPACAVLLSTLSVVPYPYTTTASSPLCSTPSLSFQHCALPSPQGLTNHKWSHTHPVKQLRTYTNGSQLSLYHSRSRRHVGHFHHFSSLTRPVLLSRSRVHGHSAASVRYFFLSTQCGGGESI